MRNYDEMETIVKDCAEKEIADYDGVSIVWYGTDAEYDADRRTWRVRATVEIDAPCSSIWEYHTDTVRRLSATVLKYGWVAAVGKPKLVDGLVEVAATISKVDPDVKYEAVERSESWALRRVIEMALDAGENVPRLVRLPPAREVGAP